MNSLNSIILEGHLTKDPVSSKTPSGTSVCKFTVASNRYYKQDGERKEEVGFFEVQVWGRLADTCSEYLEKGRGVRVVGRLQQNRWTDETGMAHSRILIVGEHVEFKSSGRSQSSKKEKSMEPQPAY
ncbi:MAG: single-stranded DNA-binding protein [Spirochaetales bacterium]|nr:single-stranded DNA-binding protein [Spirochaetales bacterium]